MTNLRELYVCSICGNVIEVLTKDQVLRAELAPNQAPEASFLVKSDDVVEVREYCNLHGLWKASN